MPRALQDQNSEFNGKLPRVVSSAIPASRLRYPAVGVGSLELDIAARPQARPVLKWAGGKRSLLPELLKRLPSKFNKYYEPFFGGGALFFELELGNAVLGDVNEELINVYRVVRDDLDKLIAALKRHRHDPDHYYRVRSQNPSRLTPASRAARLIFLNKTCFNGLYRVNRRGEFNVPFGSYKNPRICDVPNLRSAARRLRDVDLRVADYTETVQGAGRGDFVYFDPPYFPVSPTSSFVNYARDGFESEDQEKLADLFRRLDRKGVHVMLSNSAAPFIRRLYRDFRVTTVLAPRFVNSVGAKRGKVEEVIVTNYDY